MNVYFRNNANAVGNRSWSESVEWTAARMYLEVIQINFELTVAIFLNSLPNGCLYYTRLDQKWLS
jgi:hypothetical protein